MCKMTMCRECIAQHWTDAEGRCAKTVPWQKRNWALSVVEGRHDIAKYMYEEVAEELIVGTAKDAEMKEAVARELDLDDGLKVRL